jgi:hypothetical protein
MMPSIEVYLIPKIQGVSFQVPLVSINLKNWAHIFQGQCRSPFCLTLEDKKSSNPPQSADNCF